MIGTSARIVVLNVGRKTLMDQQIRSRHVSAISLEAYRMGADFQVGLPLAFYTVRPQVIRRYQRWNLVMLIGAICLFLAGLLAVLYQAMLLEKQVTHTPNALIESLLPLTLGFIQGLGAIAQMRLVARMLPVSVLVCTEGLLLIRPKKVDVTRWEEVTALCSMQETARGKKYMLSRINRKSLVFGEALEDVEGLVNQIRQYIPQRHDIK